MNGIEGRYEPIHVPANGPHGASPRAAAVQAAYASLVHVYPAQKTTFDTQLATSVANLAGSDTPADILAGLAWDQYVADQIWAWRSTDGFDSSGPLFVYPGSTAVGQWRPTLPAHALGLAPSLAHTMPWVIPSPSSFRPPGPPALTSFRYTVDFNEVKAIGGTNSTIRTVDQTTAAKFWGGTAPTFWNRAAADTSVEQHLTLLQNARLFALLDMAMADAIISCWDAKYLYTFWRPITAIQLASTDGNPFTEQDPIWMPTIPTPPYPEYTSGHATTSGAAQAVLTLYFGNHIPVTGWSEAFGSSYTRSYPSFSAAADEANVARIWGGIHFRTAVVTGRLVGDLIGFYVTLHAARTVHEHGDDHDFDHGSHGDSNRD